MTKNTGERSILDFDAATACAEASEMEYKAQGKKPTGFFISVLGAQAESVVEATTTLMDARRKRDQTRMAEAIKADEGGVEPTPFQEEVDFTRNMAACRIIGWRGVKEPYSPEAALLLVSRNAEIRDQVMAHSNNLGNFMKA